MNNLLGKYLFIQVLYLLCCIFTTIHLQALLYSCNMGASGRPEMYSLMAKGAMDVSRVDLLQVFYNTLVIN